MVDTVESEAERILAYKETLTDLVMNSGPQIKLLTGLAAEEMSSESAAAGIARVIEDRIREVRSMKWTPKPGSKTTSSPEEIGLLLLYLIDSIVKKTTPVNKAYQQLFTQNIVSNFCELFRRADEKIREKLQKLRGTWIGFFPPDKLSALDRKIKQMDPKWPFTPSDSIPQSTPQVHVNRNFVGANGATAAAERQRQLTLKKVEEDREKLRKQKELDLELENRRLKLQLARSQDQQMRAIEEENFIQQQQPLPHQQIQPSMPQQTQLSQQQQHQHPGRGKRKQHQPNQQAGKRQKAGRRGITNGQQANNGLSPAGGPPLTGSNAADLLMRSPPQMVTGSSAPLYSRRPVMDPMPFSTNGVVVYDEHHFNQNASSFLPPVVPQAAVSEYSLFAHSLDPLSGQSFVPTAVPMQQPQPQVQPHNLLFQQSSLQASVPVTVSSLLSNLSNVSAGSSSGGSVVPAHSENPLQNVLELLGMTSGQTINNRAVGQSEPQAGVASTPSSATSLLSQMSSWTNRSTGDRRPAHNQTPVPPVGASMRSSPPTVGHNSNHPMNQHNRMFGNEEPLEATVESLRIPRRSAIAKLYNGEQCSSCPQRFFTQDKPFYNKFPDEHEKDRKVYANHIQWHFRQNNKKRAKSTAAAGQSRPWYYKLADWLIFKEVNDELEIGEEEATFGREDQQDDQVDPEERTVPARSDKSENVCHVCMEEFDSKYREDEEEWVLLNAVSHEEHIYHPACLEDFLKNGGNLSTADASTLSATLDTTADSLPADSDVASSADQDVDQKDDESMRETEGEDETSAKIDANSKEADDETAKQGSVVSDEAKDEASATQSNDENPEKGAFELFDTEDVNYEDEFADIGSELKAVQEAAAQASGDQQTRSPSHPSPSSPAQASAEDAGVVAEDGNLDSDHETGTESPVRDRGNVVMRGKEESAACLIM